MCGLPDELPVEKGTAADGTPCGVSGLCVGGTCIVRSLASVGPIIFTTLYNSRWVVMGFLDLLRKWTIVEDVAPLKEFVYMFLVM